MRLRIPILLGELALAVIAVIALYLKFDQVAIGCVTGIAATLNQLVEGNSGK